MTQPQPTMPERANRVVTPPFPYCSESALNSWQVQCKLYLVPLIPKGADIPVRVRCLEWLSIAL